MSYIILEPNKNSVGRRRRKNFHLYGPEKIHLLQFNKKKLYQYKNRSVEGNIGKKTRGKTHFSFTHSYIFITKYMIYFFSFDIRVALKSHILLKQKDIRSVDKIVFRVNLC